MISLKELLSEVTYKSEVLRLSRDFINHFKKSFGKKYSYTDMAQGPGVDELGDPIEFDLSIKLVPIKNLKGNPFSIEGGAEFDEMDLTVKYNPIVFPAAYNDFIAEIKETFRHEMEHISQGQKGTIKFEERGDKPFYQYLLLRQEVPAFIKGLNKRAKTKKITLGQAFEEFFKDYKDSFKNQKEIDIVRKEWIKWAEKNLPKTKL